MKLCPNCDRPLPIGEDGPEECPCYQERMERECEEIARGKWQETTPGFHVPRLASEEHVRYLWEQNRELKRRVAEFERANLERANWKRAVDEAFRRTA